MPPTERALLESLIVDNEDLEKLELKLAQFNIFEAIGVVRQELRHSNFWSKGYIGIIPKKWEDKKLNLHLQFENYSQELIIKVIICPNEHKSMREKIHEISQRNTPPFKKKSLTPKWTTIYTKTVLKPKDYEDAELEELMNKVQEFWRHFIKNDFVTIENLINTNIDEIICKDISVHPES